MPLVRGMSDSRSALTLGRLVFDVVPLPFTSTCPQEACGRGPGGVEHNSIQDLSYPRMVWTKLLEYTNSDP